MNKFRCWYLPLLFCVWLILPACSTLMDKDNTPDPTPLKTHPATAPPVTVLWRTGTGGGQGSLLAGLRPVIAGSRIFTVSKNGTVSAFNRFSGRKIFQVNTKMTVSSGLAAGAGKLFMGTQDGRLIALSQKNGKILWKALLPSEAVAPAAAGAGLAVVKSVDGHLAAISEETGIRRWTTAENPPEMILRTASSPVIAGDSVYAGFQDGVLGKFSLDDGAMQWKQTIATPGGIFPIQRMVDIAANPVVDDNRIYTAAYQGELAALASRNGAVDWAVPVSTSTMITRDLHAIYLSDTSGMVRAFGKEAGQLLWVQNQLKSRVLTGPALSGPHLVVGDAEGWVHWLSRTSGHLVTRIRAGNDVLVTPLVADNIVYIYTKDGRLIACRLGV